MYSKLLLFGVAFLLAVFIQAGPASAQVVTCDPTIDTDCDGVPNTDDQCPNTILGGDLTIGTCTLTGFNDTVSLTTGCTLGDSIVQLITDCSDNAKNHGQFVSCVTRHANTLKKAKIITGKQKGKITSCAAQEAIP